MSQPAGTAAAPVGFEGIARALTRAIEFDGALATLAATLIRAPVEAIVARIVEVLHTVA